MEQKNVVYEIGSSDKDYSKDQYDFNVAPYQDIPEKDKTAQWYARNVRYISTFYNRPYLPSSFNAPQTPSTATSANYISQVYPVNEMINNIMYYQGKQPNLRYNHLVQDVTTTNLQSGWVKGQKVAQLIDYAKGSVRGRVNNAAFSVRTMSKDAISARETLLEKLKLKIDLKGMMPPSSETGIEFNPANGANVESYDQAEEFVNQNARDYNAELATDIATNIWVSNAWTNKAMDAFTNVELTGCCGIEHYVENGRQYQEVHPSYNLILDLRHDEEFNRKARFVGVIRLLTPEEIFRRYPDFTQEQRDDVMKMSRNNALFGPFNMPGFNFTWWNYGGSFSSPLVTCVTGYWIGREDLGKKKVTNQYGTDKIRNTKTDEAGDDWVDCVHKATFIGNKYLTDFGYVTNMVEDFNDKSKPRLPILVYTPNCMLGELRAPVGRIKEIQNDLDMIKFKIKEMVGRAKGKATVFLTNKATAKDIEEDLASMQITVISPETGEPGDGNRPSQRISETLDMTLDPNIQLLFQLHDRFAAEMEEILGSSKIALGQQQSYIGYSTQQQTIAQSTLGMSPLIDGFMDYLQMNMQYAVNQAKYIYTMEDNEEAQAIIGIKGVKFLKFTKKFRFEDLLCVLKINDFMETQAKDRILAAANIALQTGAIDFRDYIEIDGAQTYSQIKKWMIASIDRKDQKAQAAQAQAQLAAQIQAEQSNQTQQNMEMMRQEGANQRTQLKSETDLVKHATDHSMTPEQEMQQGPPQQM